MGGEIIFPIAALFLCELLIFFVLGLVYLWAIRFRNASARWLTVLRTILGIFAFLLLVPSIMYIVAGPIWIFGAFLFQIEPFSDRIVMFATGLVSGGIIAAGWWGLLRAAQKLQRLPQS